MARAPPAPARGQPAGEALPGEQDTLAAALGTSDVADRDAAFGTKTLAQLREEAIQQRRNALETLMPERAALLKDLYFVLTDKERATQFGAGLDPSGPALDPALKRSLQEKTAAFIERWIREPRVAAQIPVELPPLKPTPPLSPNRRDSTLLDMSEEVAAVERELIKPEYRKQSAPDDAGGEGSGNSDRNRTPSSWSTNGMFDDTQHNPLSSPKRDGRSSSTSHKRQQSLVSPFPVTFRSPGFSASTPPLKQTEVRFPLTVHQSTTSQEATTSSPTADGNASAFSAGGRAGPSSSSPPKAKKAKSQSMDMQSSDALPLRSFPIPYPPELPPLPDYLLKNRMNIGGLAKKKTRDRAAAQQNPQLTNTLATSADLYRLGVSRAVHSSIRSLVGAGAPPPDKSRTGGKVLSTADWHTVISEMQSQRAMERIEQLKAEKTWSLRQFRKQRPPATHKAHWDYLLEEMTWMATDYKQETRWKIATAYEIARAVKAFHEAQTDEERSAMRIRVRPPTLLEVSTQDTPEISTETDVVMSETSHPQETATDKSRSTATNGEAKPGEDTGETVVQVNVPPTGDEKKETDAVKALTPGNLAALPSAEPRHKKYQHQLLKARAPLFDFTLNTTVFDLSKAGLPEVYQEASTYDLTNELFQELMTYGPPAEPSTDSRQNRRIDESNPTYTRITNASHMLQSKPILVSTLEPARKRKPSGAWGDLTDVAGEEGRDLLAEMFGMASDVAFMPGTRLKDTGNKRFTPLAPANAEARAAAMDWTPEEDKQLFIFARQYSCNWDLIASVFNDATHRPKSDERLPWDCYDRWHKKYAPLPTPVTGQASVSTALPPTTGQAANAEENGQQVNGQMQQQQAQAQANLPQPPPKKEKRATSTTLASSTSASVPIKKPELSRAQIRHMSIIEATKKAQKKRELMQKSNMQPPIRKINLNAHESHNQPMHPGLTALDLSRLKAERERQQLEEIRKREQAKMYQQAQAAAMAQQQMQAHVQAQVQAQQQGGQPRGPIPLGMPGQPMPGGPQLPQLPPGAIPQNMLPNQPSMPGQPGQQRMSMGPPQLPAGMQMPPPSMSQQGERARSMSQQSQVPRPPSQSGQHPQQQQHIMMNGQQGPPMLNLQGSSPPMQPGLLPGMQFPMQQNGAPGMGASQSPQPPGPLPQMSPHQIQLQLQQHQNGNPQMSPAQQQALLAQLSQMRAGSPAMPMPGGYPASMPGGVQGVPQLLPNLQANQQQLLEIMRMRQNSQASSQGSVQ